MFQKILLVEDSEHKRSKIKAFLASIFADAEVAEAYSFNSGCRLVEDCHFDLVVLDMSMPTYDRAPKESGGRFRSFGGREIARKIIRRGAITKVLFITQYDSFSDKVGSISLASLDRELAVECGASYMGLIYYDSSKSAWKEEFRKRLGVI